VRELGEAYIESMDIDLLTKTHPEALAQNTGDSAALCVLNETAIVYMDRASIRTLMRLEAHVGSRFPAMRLRWTACAARPALTALTSPLRRSRH
jgi:IclR family pca regulon transcriptional regulator